MAKRNCVAETEVSEWTFARIPYRQRHKGPFFLAKSWNYIELRTVLQDWIRDE